MTEKYLNLFECNDSNKREVHEEDVVKELAKRDLNAEDYKWHTVHNGYGHSITVAWLRKDADCVAMIDVFTATGRDKLYIKYANAGLYYKGRGRKRHEAFCPERAYSNLSNFLPTSEATPLRAELRENWRDIVGVYQEWHYREGGHLIKEVA